MKVKALVCLLLLTAASINVLAQDKTDIEFMNAFHSISSEEIREWVLEMSSDKYRGRLTGTPEFIECTKWAAGLFEQWGLKPGGDNGTYFQWFDKSYVDVKNSGALSLEIPADDGSSLVKHYTFPENYFPGSNSDSGTVTAEVIFVGHGVTAPELGYDDYEGIDVKGKIVLVKDDVPYRGEESIFAKWVPYQYHQHKLNNAAKHGAAGMLYIRKIANPNTSYNKGLVYCHIDEKVVEDIFFGTGKNLKDTLAGIKETLKPNSFSTGKKATITAEGVYHPEGKAPNVIGIVPGVDPVLKDEVIIIGGHFDAVGYLGQVMPGAHDNASGSANIMAAAKAMAMSPVKPKRTVVFILIGGEECGLYGAKHYCQNPVFPIEKTVAYFNLDMVATGSGLRVSGVESFPRILKCFQEANDELIHRPLMTSKYRKPGVGRPRSDGSIFAKAGIKAFSFGTFYQKGEKRLPFYYHHPLDDIRTVNPEIMEDAAKLIFVGITKMANAEKLYE